MDPDDGSRPSNDGRITADPSRCRLAIVIGAGGFRGRAAIGVLGALSDAGLRPDALIGVSAGAVIGACWALFGWSAERMEREAGGLTVSNLAFYAAMRAFPNAPARWRARCGVIPGWIERLSSFDWSSPLENGVQRFGVICFDRTAGASRLFATGIDNEGVTLAEAVRGSAAIPRIFRPLRVEHGGTTFQLADGGVAEKLPIERALAAPFSASTVLAVSFAPAQRSRRTSDADRPFEVIGRHVIVLKPAPGSARSFITSSGSTHALVEAGRRAVTPQLIDMILGVDEEGLTQHSGRSRRPGA